MDGLVVGKDTEVLKTPQPKIIIELENENENEYMKGMKGMKCINTESINKTDEGR